MKIIPLHQQLNEFVGGDKGQDQSGDWQYHRFGKPPDQGENPGVPLRRGCPHLYRDLPDTGVYCIKEPRQVVHDPANQQLLQPVRDPVGEKSHEAPPLEQAGQQGDQGRAQQDNAAARHELFHALGLGARVIRPVALQEIDDAPHAQTSAQGHNEGLQGGDSGRKELHINLHILREYHPGHEKSRPCQAAGTLWTRCPEVIQRRPGRPGRHS